MVSLPPSHGILLTPKSDPHPTLASIAFQGKAKVLTTAHTALHHLVPVPSQTSPPAHSPSVPYLGHIGLSAIPGADQTRSYLRAFVFAVSSASKLFPQIFLPYQFLGFSQRSGKPLVVHLEFHLLSSTLYNVILSFIFLHEKHPCLIYHSNHRP